MIDIKSGWRLLVTGPVLLTRVAVLLFLLLLPGWLLYKSHQKPTKGKILLSLCLTIFFLFLNHCYPIVGEFSLEKHPACLMVRGNNLFDRLFAVPLVRFPFAIVVQFPSLFFGFLIYYFIYVVLIMTGNARPFQAWGENWTNCANFLFQAAELLYTFYVSYLITCLTLFIRQRRSK
jgi:hypothetical protein